MFNTSIALVLILGIFFARANADVVTASNVVTPFEPVLLTFCYEDKQLLPYYTGDDQTIPPNPGATIEHLIQTAEKLGIALAFVRQPWLRCLQQLEDGTVDALVASYDEERAYFTVYPKLADGSPDTSLSINQLSLCLAFRFDNPLLENASATVMPFTLARPLGYKPIPLPDTTILVEAHSPEQALELVIEGRVDATTVLCQLNNLDAKANHLNLTPITLIYPPIHQAYGYLMFSRKFFEQYPEHSKALWHTLPEYLDKKRYLEYLGYSQWK